mmetsp:Transcript_5600/g.18193  ORF Transcript_5600/g.18193 Transcript_5600/m.18193 type:complete len:288 (-) Transcript_5600:408-1271(-)
MVDHTLVVKAVPACRRVQAVRVVQAHAERLLARTLVAGPDRAPALGQRTFTPRHRALGAATGVLVTQRGGSRSRRWRRRRVAGVVGAVGCLARLVEGGESVATEAVALGQLHAVPAVALAHADRSVVLADALVQVDRRVVYRAVGTGGVHGGIAHVVGAAKLDAGGGKVMPHGGGEAVGLVRTQAVRTVAQALLRRRARTVLTLAMDVVAGSECSMVAVGRLRRRRVAGSDAAASPGTLVNKLVVPARRHQTVGVKETSTVHGHTGTRTTMTRMTTILKQSLAMEVL